MTTRTSTSREPLPARFHLAMVAAKYGLAAAAATWLATWLVPKDVLSAAFVALLCTRPSLLGAVREGRDQVLASAVGAGSTFALLVLFPIAAWTVGLSIALTYAVSTWLRWSYPTLVVALFSSLYMTILAQDTLLHTAVLRFQSVLLGVGVAIVVNVLFVPISYRANVRMRVRRGIEQVGRQVARLAEAVRLERAGAIDAVMASYGQTYRLLGELMGDMADLTREVRIKQHPAGLSLVEASAGDRALRELEWVAHYTHDVALAASRLAGQAPEAWQKLAGPTTERLAGMAEALAALEARRWEAAGEHVRAGRAALQPWLVAPGDARAEPMPEDAARLALILGLVQSLDHLGEVVQACRQLAMVERDAETKGEPHAI